ncbi:UNVERIFIED_CONTAM: hypothetical protein K2H54_020452 [Gekko kuhli]
MTFPPEGLFISTVAQVDTSKPTTKQIEIALYQHELRKLPILHQASGLKDHLSCLWLLSSIPFADTTRGEQKKKPEKVSCQEVATNPFMQSYNELRNELMAVILGQ